MKKTTVTFLDKNNNRATIKITLDEKTDGKPYLSFSGETGNSSGQCYDSITPKNEPQKQLLELWKKYHLNDMKAGTPTQERYIADMKKDHPYTYEDACRYLDALDPQGNVRNSLAVKQIQQERQELAEEKTQIKKDIERLDTVKNNITRYYANQWLRVTEMDIKVWCATAYDATKKVLQEMKTREAQITTIQEALEQAQLKTLLYDRDSDGNVIKYGAKWHYMPLPADIWDTLLDVCDAIRTIEDEEEAEDPEGSWDDIDDPRIVALAKALHMTPYHAQQYIHEAYDNVYSAEGIDYRVVTDEEAHAACVDMLEDDLWQQAVAAGNTTVSKKDWIDQAIQEDGYGHILNSWDGEELEEDDYLIFRQ